MVKLYFECRSVCVFFIYASLKFNMKFEFLYTSIIISYTIEYYLYGFISINVVNNYKLTNYNTKFYV